MYRDIEIDGATVRVHKATADRSTPVSARLLAMLGPELYQLFAFAQKDAAEITQNDSPGPLGALLNVDIADTQVLKTVVAGTVLPVLYGKLPELSQREGEGSIFWFFRMMLEGFVEYEGHRAASMAELDSMGFGVTELTRCFWTALELAIFPTQGAPATSDGNPDPEAPKTTQMSSNESDGTRRGGQSVRMSSRAG